MAYTEQTFAIIVGISTKNGRISNPSWPVLLPDCIDSMTPEPDDELLAWQNCQER